MIGSDTGIVPSNGLRGTLTDVFSQVLDGNESKTYELSGKGKQHLGRFTVKLDLSDEAIHPLVISSGSLNCSYVAGKVRGFLTTVHLYPYYNQEDCTEKEALKAVFSHIITGQEKRRKLGIGEHLEIAVKIDRIDLRYTIRVTSSESGKDRLCEHLQTLISDFVGTPGLLNYFNCPDA